MDIDDIITFHGDSVGECQVSFRAVIDDCIAACQQTGAAPEKPASGKLMPRRPDLTRRGPEGRRPQRCQPQQVGRKGIEVGEQAGLRHARITGGGLMRDGKPSPRSQGGAPGEICR